MGTLNTPFLGDESRLFIKSSPMKVTTVFILREDRQHNLAVIFLPVGILACLLSFPLCPAAAEEQPEPTLSSLFPLGGQRGTTIQVQFRGKHLHEVNSLWVRSDGFQARIKSVEPIDEAAVQSTENGKENKSSDYRVIVQMHIDSSAPTGLHPLRLVSEQGVTNALEFRVVDQPVIVETDVPGHSAFELPRLPVIIQGRLAKSGEVDGYVFQALEGQDLSVEVLREPGGGLKGSLTFHRRPSPPEVRLALFGPKGSWLDPERRSRILFSEERSTSLVPLHTKGTHRVTRSGQLMLSVSSIFGKGHPDFSYELQLFSGDHGPVEKAGQDDPLGTDWLGRTFDREVGADWTSLLESRAPDENRGPPGRSVETGSAEAGGTIPPSRKRAIEQTTESEPNDTRNEALTVSVPSVIAGTVDGSGDIDIFQFQVEPGQGLAFEIETPEIKLPYFNPRVSVVDAQDREIFTNIHRRLAVYNSMGEEERYPRSLLPKVIYNFDTGGQYFLRVRDITSRYGGPGYAYRLLVRPQIPHIGQVVLEQTEHLNLVRGQARKLTILTSREEEFTGDVAFSFQGLPPGVEFLLTAEVTETPPHELADMPVDPELILPKVQKTTIILLATAAAPLTDIPVVVRLRLQFIVNGKPAAKLLVREIPLMVVRESEKT